ncbi:MAG: tRNA (adenosine(37)-N6)-threonylcarbamoyltransferase complex transferase subunit TsaD, partial [Lachnospiraceae bacterium]|nr:tRNA (adenosine(37)-N6)-threonylcarbamoyltransferase complex transferase subunit TsaD [Lachnospiraceae bacterium]
MTENKKAKILAIESSCDETAASVVEDGRKVLSNIIYSQIDLHTIYGGVVPEIASRAHIEKIDPVIKEALSAA